MTDLTNLIEIKEEALNYPIVETSTSNMELISTSSTSKKRKIDSEDEESSVIKFVDYQDVNLTANLPKKAKNSGSSGIVSFKIQSVESLTNQQDIEKPRSHQKNVLKCKGIKGKTKKAGKSKSDKLSCTKSENYDATSSISQYTNQEFQELEFIKTEDDIKIEDTTVINQEPLEDNYITFDTINQQPKDECDTEIINYVPHLNQPSTSFNPKPSTSKTIPNGGSSSDPDYAQDDDQDSQSDDPKTNYIQSKGFYLCIHCNISFKRLYNFDRHECLICRTCNKLFTSTTTLKRHILNVHSITNEIFECKECNKTFKARVYLETHINSHEKKYECESCGKKFGSISRLNEHKIKHNNPEKLVCRVCDAMLASRSSLKFHMRTHDVERVKHLKCNDCDFTTDDNRTLVKHQKSHMKKEEKYKTMTDFVQCEKCPAKLKNIMSLKNHMYYVHSDTSFQCKICQVVLKSERNLKRHHISVHTRIKTEMK